MNFIDIVKNKQEKFSIPDSEVCKRSGISEYTFYDLKRYKLYLTRVAYFSLCAVLDIPVLDDDGIEDILAENRKLVGSPSSNLTIAAEYVDPNYLEKIEKELKELKLSSENIENKDKVIQELQMKLNKILRQLKEKEDSLNAQIQQAYSDGIKEGLEKIPIMQQANNQQFVELLKEEYSEQIERLEDALRLSRKQYAALYNYVAGYLERNVIGERLSIERFSIPYETENK